jgi:hypothetical protein
MMTFVVTGIWIAPNVSRYKTDSNKRAMMRPCPPSSASAAENCSRPHEKNHPAAQTAARNGQPNATPDPRPTPPAAASATHTAYVHKQ